jgi:hypothetical protein
MSRDIKLQLEDIANKIKSYEGLLILVQREKEITENYGQEGVKYIMAPTLTTFIHTVETGILVQPLMQYEQKKERLNEKYIEMNSLIGEIAVKDKATLQTFQFHDPLISDIKFSKENIHLFLEDFIRENHRIYGTEYNTNTTSKFYSQINKFNIIYGNDGVKEFLTNKYKDLGNNILKELTVLPNK